MKRSCFAGKRKKENTINKVTTKGMPEEKTNFDPVELSRFYQNTYITIWLRDVWTFDSLDEGCVDNHKLGLLGRYKSSFT